MGWFVVEKVVTSDVLSQGIAIHVCFPLQNVVDDTENGHLWAGYSL